MVKVQVFVSKTGIPVKFGFVPGNESDAQALKKLPLSLAPESYIYRDAAYKDYTIEEDAKQGDDINLLIQRKSN